jgi:hypothetical protein
MDTEEQKRARLADAAEKARMIRLRRNTPPTLQPVQQQPGGWSVCSACVSGCYGVWRMCSYRLFAVVSSPSVAVAIPGELWCNHHCYHVVFVVIFVVIIVILIVILFYCCIVVNIRVSSITACHLTPWRG